MELGGSPTSHLLAGQLLYAGLQDFSIVGYDLAKGPGIRFSGHSGRVNQLARDSTIGTLYSCSSDGTINFWDQRSGKSFTTLRSGSPG
jgi:WD40 repeat protein